MKLDALKFGYAAAALSALCMLFLGIAGNFNFYTGAVRAMQGWHMFFNLTPVGIIGGILEGALWGFILAYLFAWLYNKF